MFFEAQSLPNRNINPANDASMVMIKRNKT